MSVIDDAWQRRLDRLNKRCLEFEVENRDLKARIVELEACIREFTRREE